MSNSKPLANEINPLKFNLKTINPNSKLKRKMRKNYLIAFVSILMTFGCTKDDTSSSESSQNNLPFSSLGFKVEVKNDMLSFPTREDYDSALEFLGPKDPKGFETWEKEIGFQSMRSLHNIEELESRGIQDNLLATLLNSDGMIEINQNIFQIDIPNDLVSVLSTENFIGKSSFKVLTEKTRTFSTNDNVLDILEGKEETNSSVQRSSYCSTNKVDWDDSTGYLSAKVVYQKAGILNSLQSKIQQSSVNIFNLGLRTNGTNNFWVNKTSSGTIGPYETAFFLAETKSYRPYYSSRRLKDYRFSIEFFAQDKHYQGTSAGMITKTLTIICN